MVGNGKDRERGVAAALDELRQADMVAFGGVGIAGTVLPVTEAYRRVEAALGDGPENLRGQLERLLDEGTPAGRVYAATLLERVDPAAGRAAWTALRDDPAEFGTFIGCVMGRSTLREYASERLAAA
ncbi:hypothetical protein [Micromonospora peucetia]|uniref:Uncharacterized protein n=1 Tax=Micromonospora peucetia TaxID=47871 RepID=A0A1C6UTR5_9ACTN|nr:hypothetical protein [Micromonospora peucetia]WSA34818.1 hypothetical protein OIE14_12615 [Micromonospora peucetia]SCL57464.1 hypothetical protein GA0070608_1828 [Micromonospora peucetia]